MQIEHVAFFFGERRALVVAGMIQQSKTVQLRPDNRFRHEFLNRREGKPARLGKSSG
jgi:hypothetical protein